MRESDKMAKGRSYNQKASLLYLRDYLLENTNKDKAVTNKNIRDYLKSEYDIPISKKTVYTDISMLAAYGLDVEYDSQKKGYKVSKRDFTIDDLQLIVDSVQSSKFITQTKADDLIENLKNLTTMRDRSTLDRHNYVENRIRSDNEKIFDNNQIGNIHKAITAKKKISFQYLKYNIKKQKVPSTEKNNGYYKVSPFALIWSDNNYYLLGYVGKRRINFRVDRMNDITILDEKREAEKEYEALNIDKYSTNLFSMFMGKPQHVQLRFRNELIGVVIDRFGVDVRIMTDGEEHFIAFVAVETSPLFFGWLCGFGKAVEIVSPLPAVKKMGEYVSEIAKMYENDTKE